MHFGLPEITCRMVCLSLEKKLKKRKKKRGRKRVCTQECGAIVRLRVVSNLGHPRGRGGNSAHILACSFVMSALYSGVSGVDPSCPIPSRLLGFLTQLRFFGLFLKLFFFPLEK